MSDNNGNFKADIPQDALEAALRSVEGGSQPEAGGGAGAGEAADPKDQQIRQLKALLDESASRARETQERLKDTHERYLRTAADFENWKKRSAKEREDTVKFGNERLLKDLLPVVDNLERAVQSAGAEKGVVIEGVRMVLRQFVDTLGRYGVKSFSAVGQPFDPNRHEALMQQESAEVAPGTVLSEMTKGYLLHDRLVRPAAVVVSKAPEQPAAGPDGASGPEGASVH